MFNYHSTLLKHKIKFLFKSNETHDHLFVAGAQLVQALVSLNHRLLILNCHSLRGSVTQKTGEFLMHRYIYIKVILLKCLKCQKIKKWYYPQNPWDKNYLQSVSNHMQSNLTSLRWSFCLVSADSLYNYYYFLHLCKNSLQW